MDRTYFEVYEELKKNSKYDDSFCESYKECYSLERLEGKVFKGVWSGYSIKPENDDKTYFTYEGIRGTVSGIFAVHKGKIIELTLHNDSIFKDKYREFVHDLYRYISAKQQANKVLLELPEVKYEVKTQLTDIQSAYDTLLQLMSVY